MAFESLSSGYSIPDPKEDKKTAVKVEQFKVSDSAVYLPRNQYMPLDAVEKMQIRHAMMNTKGCCGLSFPVYNVILFGASEAPVKIMCEKERSADRIVELISASHPQIVFEEYIPPHKDQTVSET